MSRKNRYDNDLDTDWKIDIKKSKASPPKRLKIFLVNLCLQKYKVKEWPLESPEIEG